MSGPSHSSDSDTYPAIYTDSILEKRIDYMFTSDNLISVTEAGIAKKTLVSNHLSTFADIQLC